jgi:hypothetical protein
MLQILNINKFSKLPNFSSAAMLVASQKFKTRVIKKRFRHCKVVNDARQDISSRHYMKLSGGFKTMLLCQLQRVASYLIITS